MTDSDDELKRRYRELASEMPSPAIDAAILARARRRRPWIARWGGPVSIAAVLVLGIGVSLRMQLEQPGVETSAPERSELQARSGPAPVPTPIPASKDEARQDAFVASPPQRPAPEQPAPPAKPKAARESKERVAATPLEANVATQAITAPSTTTAIVTIPPPAPAAAAPAAPPVAPAAAPPPAAALGRAYMEPQRNEPAPQRAKREAEADRVAASPAAGALADSAGGARELRKSLAAETDPARELERIAKLREAGQHDDADKALAEFRKRFPDFRIPDAMWERVRTR